MKKYILSLAIGLAILAGASSCNDSVSYADLLNTENQAVNNFLCDQRVELDIPADTVFRYGPDAPYYRMNEDGTIYMQVLNPGTKGNKAKDDELIYFRYTRYQLTEYADGKLPEGGGNNLTLVSCWFRYRNFRLQGSYQWGEGIQLPLSYLPVDCEVNVVIKSRVGIVEEQTNVQPFLYRLTYQRPVI